MIKVKRDKDGKIFTTDMSGKLSITEMHFCTSYTQVMTQEEDDTGFIKGEIICPPVGTEPNFIDMIAVKNDDTGRILDNE